MPGSADFWDRTARKYAASPIKDMEAYEATLARVRAHLTPGHKVLEVGCGTGTTALKLAGAAGHITASDISAEMVEIGRGKAAAEGVQNVTFVQGTFGGAALGEGPYDAALGFNLLHLVEDLPAALDDVHKRLAPGGLFISKTPCLAARGVLPRLMLPMMLLFIRLRYFAKPPFVRFLSAGELEDVIKAAGFEIVEAEGIPVGHSSHFIVARKL